MRSIDRTLIVICALALAVRLIYAFAASEPTDTGEMDAYNAVAVSGVFSPTTPPLYPLFLRAIYQMFGMRAFTAVYAIQGVIGCLVVIALFYWVNRFFDRTIAVVAAALAAGYPNFILYNAAVLPVSLGVTLIASIIAVSTSQWRAGQKSVISAALTGGGVLMNPAYVFFVPGLVATTRRKLIFAAVLGVVLATWIVRTAIVHDTLVPVYDPGTFDFRLDAYGRVRDAWDVVGIYYYCASAFMGEGWRSYVMDGTFSRISTASHVRTFSYAVLMLLGLAGLIRYYRREHRAFLLPFLGYVVLFSILAPPDGRQRAMLEPLLVFYAAALFVNEYREVRSWCGREHAGADSGDEADDGAGIG